MVNAKGLIKVLYAPFRVLCKVDVGNIPKGTWVYVEEVYSNDKDELIYYVYGQLYSHKQFGLQINF
jgi:hypothetical protein